MRYTCKIIKLSYFDDYQTSVSAIFDGAEISALTPIPYDDAKNIFRENSVMETDIYIFSGNIESVKGNTECLSISKSGGSVLLEGKIETIRDNSLFSIRSKSFLFDMWSTASFIPHIGENVSCSGSFEIFPVSCKFSFESCWN